MSNHDGAAPQTADGGQTPAGQRIALLRDFLHTEAGGAVVLLAATVAALVRANSPWGDAYDAFWEAELALTAGAFELSGNLRDWVNDGLMTLFFLLIGLEVRREFDLGEFRERRRVAVPILAAVGGMLFPVLIFLAIVPDTEAGGWAMVMATDTAFAVGVLALVGRRSSFRLRTFLLTLVIVDDVAAVTVIAVAYTAALDLRALAIGVALLGGMALLRARGVQQPAVYVLLTVGIWLAAWTSGVHPSVAGVAVGLLTSAYPPRRVALEEATGLARAFRMQPTSDLARRAARRITLALSPNERMQHGLHPWTSFVIVPLFALANAGLDLTPELVAGAFGSPLVIGVVLALVVGKSLGIPIGAWLATHPRLGGGRLPVGWPSLVAAASVAGIGFTVSLLIAELSYRGAQLDQAKLGIFAASVSAALLSVGLFYGLSILPPEWLRRTAARAEPPVVDLIHPVDPDRDHLRGAPHAPLTLVEYGDFECPHCARAAPAVRQLLERFEGRLRFVFRHLPLTDVHPHAALAAEAAEAAADQDAFWPMHDRLFERRDALELADLVGYAADLGLDTERFERDLRDGRFAARVAREIHSAEAAGAAGAPTFFVDDLRHDGPHDVESLAAALRAAAVAGGVTGPGEERRSRGAGR